MIFFVDDWRMVIFVINLVFIVIGVFDDGEFYVDLKILKVIRYYKRFIEKEYFKWLNYLWNVGIFDREIFV